MPVRGALRDLNTIDLIQLPRAGRKTGELVVSGAGGDGKIWYSKGDAVHASFGGHEGMDAIARMVDLAEGDYVFRFNIVEPKRTIELNIHRALMLALKMRDERRLREALPAEGSRAPKATAAPTTPKASESANSDRLMAVLASTSFAVHVCLLSAAGTVIERVSRGKAASETSDSLFAVVAAIRRDHPRRGLSRILLEDEKGIVAAQVLAGGAAVVLVGQPQAPMGEVMLVLSRLVRLFDGK